MLARQNEAWVFPKLPTFRAKPKMSENPITNRELLELSREIGSEWEQVGLLLEYQQPQIERLKMLYPHKVQGRISTMLTKWHEVVVSCSENPRMLLASMFLELKNRQLASKVILNRNLLDAAEDHSAKSSTIKRIHNINFDPQAQQPNLHPSYSAGDVYREPVHTGAINHGAPGSINMYGGELNINGSMSLDGSGVTGPPHHSFSSPEMSSMSAEGSVRTNVGAPASLNIYAGRVNTAPNSHIGVGPGGVHLNQLPVYDQCRGEGADCLDGRSCNKNEYKKAADDTLNQTLTDSFGVHMKLVGALIASNSIGTVFRVGTKYVMTAWHVVRDIIDPLRTGSLDFDRLESNDVFINFNEDPIQPPSIVYRVEKDPPFYDEDLDVAVLEIKNPTGLPLPFFLCNDSTIEMMGISDVSFIGYGHPNSNKKNLDPRCQIISQFSHDAIPAACAYLQRKRGYYRSAVQSNGKNPSVVDLGYQGYDHESKLLFNCFMEHGASGSPAITTKDPKTLKVVGVLTHGIPEFFFDLPKIVKSQFPNEYRFEMGSRMKHIYEAMHTKNIILAQDLFGSNS